MQDILTHKKSNYKDEADSIKSIMDTMGCGKSELIESTGLSRHTIYRFFKHGNTDFGTYVLIKNAVSAKAIRIQKELSKQLKTA